MNTLQIDVFCCSSCTATRFMRMFLEWTMMDPLVQRPEHRTHHLPSVLKTLTNLIGIVCFFHVDTKHNLARNLRMSANMNGGKSVQMMTADVNATRANVFLPLWSDCPLHPSSIEAEPTMLEATWREQAHRARRTSSETCNVATHGSQ